MLEMTLLGPWGTRAGFWRVSVGWPPWVYEAATWGVIFFELAAGFAFHIGKIQKLAMFLGLLLHVSIWMFLGIPEFMICVTVYVLFLHPKQVRIAGERLWHTVRM
jgi:hypothetical protein